MIASLYESFLLRAILMAGMASVSRSELSQRRKQLRRQRRAQRFQAFGRFMIVAGIAAGAVWTVRQPIWVIRQVDQIKVEGNQYLSDHTIQKLVPIQYPQSIFRTQPQQIVTTLKQKAPLAEVRVERQLFPPGLIIRIKEQTPVATVNSKVDAKYRVENHQTDRSLPPPDSLLDEQGNVIPLETYTGLEQQIKLPGLKVLGNPEPYRQKWREFYQLIKSSGIPVQQVDWRDSNNLILVTDLGVVHLGTYGTGTVFRQQLRALEALRKLPEKVPKHQIIYIDLRNPNAPALQKKSNSKPAEILDSP
jgi:cell division protein FtsQ